MKQSILVGIKTTLIFSMVFFVNQITSAQSSQSEYETLKTYMVSNHLDLNQVMDRKTWIPGPEDVIENLSDYFIIDIRQDDIAPKNGTPDFEDGHLPGAKNTSYQNILKFARANQAPDRILVVSQDGQAAAAAAVALRLAGYPNTKVLKFGMAGWNSRFDNWKEQRSSFAINHKNWSKTPAAETPSFHKVPQINTGKKSGKEILEAQVQAYLDRGFDLGVSAYELMAAPQNYYVVNQSAPGVYKSIGYVQGAYEIEYPVIAESKKFGDLANYPPDQTIVQYCYTGHAGLTAAAWLNVLGYDAKALTYGVNSLAYDAMPKSKYGSSKDYAFITGK